MGPSTLRLPDWATSLLGALPNPPDTLIAALVSAVATLVLALGMLPRQARTDTSGPTDGAEGPDACVFLIDGAALSPLTAAARALLGGLSGTGSRIQALGHYLAAACPTIQRDLEGLVLYGEAFRRQLTRPDGTVLEVAGLPNGGTARLVIRPASEDARAREDAERLLERSRAELRFLREVLDRAPVMAFALAPDGQVSWANAAYRERFDGGDAALPDHRIPHAFGHVLEEVPLTVLPGRENRRRVALPGGPDPDVRWFEISQTAGPSGETLFYASAADDLVAAEAALRRFVETLTETFAHLPIGLAVFDKNRRLGLFNPALSDLVKIDAVWLAGRPSLRDFLERLRETRQMPEQKDFAAFRRMLAELEEGARDGTYEENWVLPSGKIFRVTGRPHPQGALAFLFEDISATITLERRYRSELELSQATLDRMAEAVAVFDTSGMLVFVNSAFERLWGVDPMAGLEGPAVAEMAALWEARSAPSPVWSELCAFATGAETRTAWDACVETLAGGRLRLLVAPLPNGSTLVVFRDGATAAEPGAERALRDAATAGELGLGLLELPVEMALRGLGAAIPSAPNPETFATLTVAAQGLKEALDRARELRGLAERALDRAASPAEGLIAPRLAEHLEIRGLSITDEGAGAQALTERALAALALALGALAAPGATVTAGPADGGGLRLAAPAGTEDGEPVALLLARRRIETEGGHLECMRRGGQVLLEVQVRAASEASDLPLAPRAPTLRLAATGARAEARAEAPAKAQAEAVAEARSGA